MELDTYLRADSALRSGSRKAGGNYLADAVEALVAAIYLDGGIDAARAFVHRYWEPHSLKVVEKPVNPKGELQEWIAKSSEVRPAYVIEGRDGPDHSQSSPCPCRWRATRRPREAAVHGVRPRRRRRRLSW